MDIAGIQFASAVKTLNDIPVQCRGLAESTLFFLQPDAMRKLYRLLAADFVVRGIDLIVRDVGGVGADCRGKSGS